VQEIGKFWGGSVPAKGKITGVERRPRLLFKLLISGQEAEKSKQKKVVGEGKGLKGSWEAFREQTVEV